MPTITGSEASLFLLYSNKVQARYLKNGRLKPINKFTEKTLDSIQYSAGIIISGM